MTQALRDSAIGWAQDNARVLADESPRLFAKEGRGFWLVTEAGVGREGERLAYCNLASVPYLAVPRTNREYVEQMVREYKPKVEAVVLFDAGDGDHMAFRFRFMRQS